MSTATTPAATQAPQPSPEELLAHSQQLLWDHLHVPAFMEKLAQYMPIPQDPQQRQMLLELGDALYAQYLQQQAQAGQQFGSVIKQAHADMFGRQPDYTDQDYLQAAHNVLQHPQLAQAAQLVGASMQAAMEGAA